MISRYRLLEDIEQPRNWSDNDRATHTGSHMKRSPKNFLDYIRVLFTLLGGGGGGGGASAFCSGKGGLFSFFLSFFLSCVFVDSLGDYTTNLPNTYRCQLA